MSCTLAASFARQAEIRGYRAELVKAGHVITSRWLDLDPACDSWATELSEASQHQAECDVADVNAARTVVSFTSPGRGRGGRHVEYGLALAWGKELIVVGPREHIFHQLFNVRHYETPAGFLAAHANGHQDQE
jgi:hypothetical protein